MNSYLKRKQNVFETIYTEITVLSSVRKYLVYLNTQIAAHSLLIGTSSVHWENMQMVGYTIIHIYSFPHYITNIITWELNYMS